MDECSSPGGFLGMGMECGFWSVGDVYGNGNGGVGVGRSRE